MQTKRSDLAMECHEIWKETAGRGKTLAGVREQTRTVCGYEAHEVVISSESGAKALGRPCGTYTSIDLTTYWGRSDGFFPRAVKAVGTELKDLIGEKPESVLVVGLGNASMTPDAIGPEALQSLLVTRHLTRSYGDLFGAFCPVSALSAGVTGTTGMESAEIVRGAAAETEPAAVIVIDALASRRLGRLGTTVQLSDTGIVPGSGVGNHRAALNEKTLGVPVYAIGVPTVVDAATLTCDVLEEAGMADLDPAALRGYDEAVFVTTREIDAQVRELARVIGYGVNFALQNLTVEEITSLLQ